MPSRMIRESILDSERYLECTESERLFFLHLMLLADDFGCVSLAPAFIGRRAFSERPSDVRLTKMVASLVDADLIRRYEFEGAIYGFVPRFRQRLQRMSLKCPMPPESLISDDKIALENFNRIKSSSRNPSVGHLLANRSPTVGQPPEVEVEVEVEEKKKRSKRSLRSNQHAPATFRPLVDLLPQKFQTVENSSGQDQQPENQEPDALSLRAHAAGITQREGEPRGQFALRVAQATSATPEPKPAPQAKGKFED